VIEDWQRGNIPFFTQPPKNLDEEKWETKIIEEDDPEVANPLMVISETAGTTLTKAQNEIMAGIGRLREENEKLGLSDEIIS
jgi:hypothetical protein